MSRRRRPPPKLVPWVPEQYSRLTGQHSIGLPSSSIRTSETLRVSQAVAEVSTSEVASWSIGSLEPLPGAGDPSLAPQALVTRSMNAIRRSAALFEVFMSVPKNGLGCRAAPPV